MKALVELGIVLQYGFSKFLKFVIDIISFTFVLVKLNFEIYIGKFFYFYTF